MNDNCCANPSRDGILFIIRADGVNLCTIATGGRCRADGRRVRIPTTWPTMDTGDFLPFATKCINSQTLWHGLCASCLAHKGFTARFRRNRYIRTKCRVSSQSDNLEDERHEMVL